MLFVELKTNSFKKRIFKYFERNSTRKKNVQKDGVEAFIDADIAAVKEKNRPTTVLKIIFINVNLKKKIISWILNLKIK